MSQKNFFTILFLLLQLHIYSQNKFYEKPPVFPECESVDENDVQACFDNQVFNLVFNNFKVPDVVSEKNYKGEVVILFEVDTEGAFRVIYVDALYAELKDEASRVFNEFPKIKPGTYNGNPTFKQYSFALKIPLVQQAIKTKDLSKDEELAELENGAKTEYDSIAAKLKPYSNKEYSSQLNIPFTHDYYSKFDRSINLVGTNSHTSSKPLMYEDVSKYYSFEAEKEALATTKSTLAGRKLWNERLVRIEGEDYWFAIDPIFDFQVGKDTEAEFSSTFNNTRGISIQGGLGKTLSFYTSVFESQGRFAEYYNQYAESIKARDEVAVIPGRGIAKRFKEDAYDYPVAEAYLSYTPVKFFNIQFGQGKNFIGDGYRSLLTSDVASPAPFLKLNTTFWKIKYTNTWMWLRDTRREAADPEGAYLSKYMATHFLSWNATKRLNIGLFESVIWAKTDNRGFDVSYLNPIIFYRAIEFETGQNAGNAVLGLSGKYKLNDNMNLYGQFILDEFSLADMTGGNKSWKNKYGYQIGFKYYEAFKVKNLMLQAEYNRVRPYTYSHNTIVLNYGHNNQSMAHLWGSNFSEFILIGRYHYNRWFGNAKVVMGERGFDFNDGVDNFSYGGDIYRNYNERPYDTGVTVGQGNRTTTFFANLQAGYLINPATNLKLFADITFRDFNPDTVNATTFKSNTVWFNLGIRTDLFNWYFDL
ncbi:capsule assembly Wzi family protein [Bizionia myxarmorum]|uniref:Capsule assembly Wzi family protein n=1 Tax=Bizionia myxarmorum TaxID=291186 RepID=A0A5D0RA89_9FLAO|nr:capsule assembly Wzi family protein [Bizionia myxarmorum]TYB78397.1 capsule assembly Wzi family protein [Bizionia myxarmorum]